MDAPLDGLLVNQMKFVYKVATPLTLQAYKGSALRGALMGALRDRFCPLPASKGDELLCAACSSVGNCPVAQIMSNHDESELVGRGHELPHPYVIEPPLTSQTSYQPGEQLEFGLTFFGDARATFPYLLTAAREMGMQGLGLGHEPGRMNLREVWAVNPLVGQQLRLYHHQQTRVGLPEQGVKVAQVRAFAATLPPDTLTVRLLTPTQLKAGGSLLQSGPVLSVLINRLLERLWSLAVSCGLGEAEERSQQLARLQAWRGSWPQLLATAGQAAIANQGARWQELERYSSRADAKLQMSGLVGEVRYVGDLAPLREVLAWGQLTHVGKYAVAGNGWYELDC